MILTNIAIQLDIDSDSKDVIDYCYSLFKKSRHIFNYIERECLKPLRFHSLHYGGIVISLRYGYEEKFMKVEPDISPNNSLVIVLPFDKERYDNLKTDNEFREFIYDCMFDAFAKAKFKYEIPSSEIFSSYNNLKENNFINEWLHQKKTDRSRKIIAELRCALSITKFILKLKISKDEKTVYNRIILSTDPDEVDFYHRFKDIIIKKNEIIITSKSYENLIKIPASAI